MVKMRDGRDSSEHIAEMKDENELLKDYVIASPTYVLRKKALQKRKKR